ncbi:MAG: hypothetical protein PGN21_05205 [Sphingomonas paucimobilis]
MKLPLILSMFLPRKRTTEEDARRAMIACGINPDDIAWTVGVDGSFAFGRDHPHDEAPTDEQIERLVDWTVRKRIKLKLIAWESTSA